MRILSLAGVLILIALGGATLAPAPVAAQPVTTTPSGLQIIDTKPGTGPAPKTGQTCVMHYTGWLYENGAKG
jgi:peptidylprolyl isomerase